MQSQKIMQMHYLSDKALSQRYSIARSTVWRWSQEGKLPKPKKLNGSTRWLLSDLEAWEQREVQA
jgi:prophage regulatory protein